MKYVLKVVSEKKRVCFLKLVVHPTVDGKWMWGRGY
jgi:hypothetical protein